MSTELFHHCNQVEEFYTDHRDSERNTRRVIALTVLTMIIEIAAGVAFGSMALLADGLHMLTHVAALSIAVFAYRFARHHADDPHYSFGTGKVGVLGGYTSAIALVIVALLMAFESVQRLFEPHAIRFSEAILVAFVGLLVNLASAWLLHQHPNKHSGHSHDHNLRAAYLHVLADALTSILAILALIVGKFLGWAWMDPLMGIAGAFIILRWSVGLLHDTSPILLDSAVDAGTVMNIRAAVEAESDSQVADLHVWQVSPHHLAAMVSVVSQAPKTPEYYKQRLLEVVPVTHVTVEVNRSSAYEGDRRERTAASG